MSCLGGIDGVVLSLFPSTLLPSGSLIHFKDLRICSAISSVSHHSLCTPVVATHHESDAYNALSLLTMRPDPEAVTVTTLQTTIVDIEPSVVTLLTTTTTLCSTTISITPGAHATIASTQAPVFSAPSTQIPALFGPTVTNTVTATDFAVALQDPFGAIYSTVILTQNPQATSHDGPFVYTSDNGRHGFDSWSPGAKAGLIVGVVLAGLIILFLLLRWCKARNEWIAHDWRWARHVEGPTPNPNMNIVPTVQAPGAMTPYGHGGQPYYYPTVR